MPTGQTVFLIVLGTISMVGGLVLGFRIMKVRRWPTTHGEIISRNVEKTKQAAAVGKPAFRFEAAVKYTYIVKEHKYTGHQLFLAHRIESQAAAQKRLDALPDKITVHYNSAKPEEACVFVDSLALPIFVMLFGLVLLFVGISLI